MSFEKSFEIVGTMGIVIPVIFFSIFFIVVVCVIVKSLKYSNHKRLFDVAKTKINESLENSINQIKEEKPKNLYCEYCGSLISETDSACKSCGAKNIKK
ncbi:MAG: hypothetical protein IKM43_02980 [Clostridia bacterium]|nr:hypothetical protein [Clostridia bacterium]